MAGQLLCVPHGFLHVFGQHGDASDDAEADTVLIQKVAVCRTQVRLAISEQEKCELAHPFLQSSCSLSFASFMSASTSSGERLKFSMENAYTVTQCMFMFKQTSSSCKAHT